MSCGVGRRCGSGLILLWLWPRLAATAPIGPLAWELSYAMGVALKFKKKNGFDVLHGKHHHTNFLFIDIFPNTNNEISESSISRILFFFPLNIEI